MLIKGNLIGTSRWVVGAGLVVDRVFLVAVVVGLVASWVFASRMAGLMIGGGAAADIGREMAGLRWMLLVGVVMAVAIDRLLVALMAIIESTRAGEPFVAANAGRLRRIGWALVVLQLLDVPAVMIGRFFPGMGTGLVDPFGAAAGWTAVLMVFVLSRVFEVGSGMREDLEGTV